MLNAIRAWFRRPMTTCDDCGARVAVEDVRPSPECGHICPACETRIRATLARWSDSH